ncbi:LAQU0S01e06964g1_1 [Lachancea quebecensis]|uniref:Spindle pole component 29 n=1 Tax=Lachancea quebecensis TaxID=1654605 RepID=A0A0P1KLG8_9SACH|nr:LAQU0S01e06964g1_1 [Lachancea quebecensis]
MSQPGLSAFLNNPETDDTLQNIRREYLASKKNLQNLLVTSPTTARTRPHLQIPTPPIHGSKERADDDKLRQQLREGLQPDRFINRPPQMPIPTAARSDIEDLRSMLYSQQRIIDDLTRGLDVQAVRNSALENRVNMMERYIAQLESREVSRSSESQLVDEGVSRRLRQQHAPIYRSDENTHALLNLGASDRPDRQISNFDDSTTKLLQIARDSSRW